MELLAEQIADAYPEIATSKLQDRLLAAPDFSELFVIDLQGMVTHSTYGAHINLKDLPKKAVGAGCGRVPNDVLGDLLQREASHIYTESGDNYIFMVDSRFEPGHQQGIALSRSRFEDNTFSHGENLKSGIHTKWGTVQVKRHTEFEIRFTDAATGQLHPGVRKPYAMVIIFLLPTPLTQMIATYQSLTKVLLSN